MCVGLYAKALAKETHDIDPDEAFIAGLLHDLGKLVMTISNQVELEEVLVNANKDKKPLYLVEEEKLKSNHAKFGEELAKHWNFPEELMLPIKFHHSKNKSR